MPSYEKSIIPPTDWTTILDLNFDNIDQKKEITLYDMLYDYTSVDLHDDKPIKFWALYNIIINGNNVKRKKLKFYT